MVINNGQCHYAAGSSRAADPVSDIQNKKEKPA